MIVNRLRNHKYSWVPVAIGVCLCMQMSAFAQDDTMAPEQLQHSEAVSPTSVVSQGQVQPNDGGDAVSHHEEKSPPVDIPPLPVLDNQAARVEAAHLVRLMKHDIAHFTTYTPARRAKWIHMAKEQLALAHTPIERPQIIMVVDRNPRVQAMSFILALPEGEWMVLGGTHVSTGQAGRKYYYITPTGVFRNTAERLGYRALGTKNKLGVRGIGLKGMRVWDMGWQWAEKGWLPSREKGQIRLEIHATDPALLEWKIGHTASEGCIRIPTSMNRFMDNHGLIDVLYEQAASYDIRFRSLLPKERTPTPIAGDAVVVVDSAEQSSTRKSDHGDKPV